MNDDYKPATGVGRFAVKVEGDKLKIGMRIFIDSALEDTEKNKFTLNALPIIKQHWEGKFGFKCSNHAFPLLYKPEFDIKYTTGADAAHWVMIFLSGAAESVSREPNFKTRKLANAPNSAKMMTRSATDSAILGSLGTAIVSSLRASFPFYADTVGGKLSTHARQELKLLARELSMADASAVLAVTAYGSSKNTMQADTIALLKAAGLNNVLKRGSKKIMAASSPKTNSANYVKVVLKSGLGEVDVSSNPLFRYPATIVHEFGHMLGLVDEYRCLSDEAADKMAELDFIHPKEKDQFQGHQGGGADAAAAASQTSQALLAQWCKTADIEPAHYGTRTISIMSNGSEFYPRHFITLWKAICDQSAANTAPDEWSIVALD